MQSRSLNLLCTQYTTAEQGESVSWALFHLENGPQIVWLWTVISERRKWVWAGKMVGATGFEPATSWSQTKCSSQAELRSDFGGAISTLLPYGAMSFRGHLGSTDL